MPGNAFIKIKGLDGESLQDGHKSEIDIADFGWDVSAETSFTKGGGASVGKATPGTFTWKHYFDTASPLVMLKCVVGQHFEEIKLFMCKTTGKATPEVYFTMTMKMCFITKATVEGGEDGSVNQAVEMVFKDVLIEYKMQKNDGTLVSTPKSFKWDIPVMKAEVG